MNIVIVGLSITSSWGNGHATTYRALVRGLASRGHRVLFLERNASWYAENRDLPKPPYCEVQLYEHTDDLRRAHAEAIAEADLVIVGSYVPDGVAVSDTVLRLAEGCTAFYDIDTPVTLAGLERGTSGVIFRFSISIFLSPAGPRWSGSSDSSARRGRGRSIAHSTPRSISPRTTSGTIAISATSERTVPTGSPRSKRS
jgi:hypothetical protein